MGVSEDIRLRTIVDASPIAMTLGNARGEIVSINPAAERMFGYSQEEMFVIGIQGITHPDDWGIDLALFEQLAIGALDRYEIEKRYLHKSGRLVWGRLVVSCSRDAAGHPEFLVGMVEDITDRKRAEAALADTARQLRESQKLESLGRLTGGIAHDFNNLLTVILSYTDLLGRRLSGGVEARYVGEMREAATRAADLTGQLLAFSRQQVLAPRVLDLNALLDEMRTLLVRLLGEERTLRVVLAPSLGHVRSDASQLQQVLMNLIVNARDATAEGGEVTITTRDDGPSVVLEVCDTGAGMDAETRERVFEPFFTTKERGVGTGLGLAIVYGIVVQSGGEIAIESTPGHGTTMRISLPRVDEALEPTGAPGEPARPDSRRGTETVLLVEDAVAVREVTREILEHHGYQVLAAESSDQALRLAGQHGSAIRLILTDVVMPARMITQIAPLCPAARVLYMSGYTDHAFVREAQTGARFAFLAKPFTPDSLSRKVRDVLDSPQGALV